MATRLAKTPLAIADAHAPGEPIMFANDAFAALVGADASSLVGRPLGTLAPAAVVDIERGGTIRFELAIKGAGSMPAALSTAAVSGADGRPFCLLCSLVDARGEGAETAIARDAELLAQVAQAAGDLMRESAIAAHASTSRGPGPSASEIALDAVDHVAQAAARGRA